MLPHWCKTHSRKAVPHVHVMHQFLLHTERPARGQEPSAGEWCINDRFYTGAGRVQVAGLCPPGGEEVIDLALSCRR